MTDGPVLLSPDGMEAKAFHVRDGVGVALAHRAGLRTGLVSGRLSEAVTRRAAELGMAVVRQGVKDKGAALREVLAEQGLTARQVAYIGDDINDLPILAEVGLSAAPADAVFEVKAQGYMITEARGGQGRARGGGAHVPAPRAPSSRKAGSRERADTPPPGARGGPPRKGRGRAGQKNPHKGRGGGRGPNPPQPRLSRLRKTDDSLVLAHLQ